MRLDSREAILAGGDSGPAIEPGNPGESLLVEAIRHESIAMPPKGKLTDPEVAALVDWVKAGAPWPGGPGKAAGKGAGRGLGFSADDRAWWAFQPVREPSIPVVDDRGWSRGPLDRFLFARMKAEGLTPAPEADKLTLIRRATFDATGLPPTPAEVDAFLADDSPDAYESLVDRLLGSPHHGERWARHWLDLVRYADSDGYRIDQYRPQAWHYRDYLVRAFNEDKPYDRLVREQIAGDELYPGDPDALIATGYLRHGIYEYNSRDVRGQWDGHAQRHHRHHGRRLPRPGPPVRPLPQPQVRPDPPGRLLPAPGVLRAHPPPRRPDRGDPRGRRGVPVEARGTGRPRPPGSAARSARSRRGIARRPPARRSGGSPTTSRR